MGPTLAQDHRAGLDAGGWQDHGDDGKHHAFVDRSGVRHERAPHSQGEHIRKFEGFGGCQT
jgi:hypothetical protein